MEFQLGWSLNKTLRNLFSNKLAKGPARAKHTPARRERTWEAMNKYHRPQSGIVSNLLLDV